MGWSAVREEGRGESGVEVGRRQREQWARVETLALIPAWTGDLSTVWFACETRLTMW